MSSRRSRTSGHHSRGTKDRTVPRSRPQMPSYTSVDYSLDDSPMSHFSLSSSNPISGTSRDYNISNWLQSDPSCSPDDDYSLLNLAMPGQTAATADDAMLYQPIMMSANGYGMPSSFDPVSAGVESRHAPVNQMTYGDQHFSSMPVTSDAMHVTSLPMDISFPSSFQDISPEYCDSSFIQQDSWAAYGIPSPPLTNSSSGSDERSYMSELPVTTSMTGMSSVPYRHGPTPPQETVCENLGPSLIQPWCGPGSTTTRPRPLRSASEKKETHQDRGYQQSSHSPEENNKPRDDPLYEQGPDAKGFYHCPFYRSEKCAHNEPTKQKCIYAKYLDSHLRPYRCKVQKPECQEKVFSSNACLFRHEREAHGFHGHGENPHPCWVQGCDRAKPGNGFPRKWNLGDHMKRVHNITMTEGEDQSIGSNDRHSSNASAKKRKGSNGSLSVQMKRSSSSQAKAQAASASYSRDGRQAGTTSRHAPQVSYSTSSRTAPSCNYQDTYSIPMESVQFAQMGTYQQQMSRHAPSYSSNYRQASYVY